MATATMSHSTSIDVDYAVEVIVSFHSYQLGQYSITQSSEIYHKDFLLNYPEGSSYQFGRLQSL